MTRDGSSERRRWGAPSSPGCNAHPPPRTGRTAGFVLANGSMSPTARARATSAEIIEADLVDCMVALPDALLHQARLRRFLARDKRNKQRDRRGEPSSWASCWIACTGARDDDIQRIAGTYHAWRGRDRAGGMRTWRASRRQGGEIAGHGFVLTGALRRAEEVEDDGEPSRRKCSGSRTWAAVRRVSGSPQSSANILPPVRGR